MRGHGGGIVLENWDWKERVYEWVRERRRLGGQGLPIVLGKGCRARKSFKF
jgi:hypothetical protein